MSTASSERRSKRRKNLPSSRGNHTNTGGNSSVSTSMKKTSSPSSSVSSSRTKHQKLVSIDFDKLDISTLKKYKRHYKVKTRSNLKHDLVSATGKHFSSLPVNEEEILYNFLYSLQTRTE